jgi:hypothetical protein
MATPQTDDPAEKLKKALALAGGVTGAVAPPKAIEPPPWYTQEGVLGQSAQIAARATPGLGTIIQAASTYLPHDPNIPKPPQTMTDEELSAYLKANPNDEGAKHEEGLRWQSAGRNFVQNLTDPKTMSWAASRLLNQVGAGARNTIDVPAQLASLYSLGSLGAEKLADLIDPVSNDADEVTKKVHNFGSQTASEFANDRYLEALRAAGVSPPREFGESAANLAGGLLPIPVGDVKGVAQLAEWATPFVIGKTNLPSKMAINWAASTGMDQTMHHVFDAPDSPYQDVFDEFHVGMPDSINATTLGTIAAAATLPLWGPMGYKFLKNKYIKPPKPVAINALDPQGPKNLYTLTTSADVLKGHWVDDKDVIADIARRAGINDPDFMKKILDNETQAAAQSKVNEALNSGNMSSTFGNFTAPVAPKQIVTQFDMLNPSQQALYERYMRMGSYADVLRARIASGKPRPQDYADLQQIQTARNQLRMANPTLSDFSKSIQTTTGSVRKFLGQGPYAIYDAKTLKNLEQSFPQNIPLIKEAVEPTAPLLERIKQADDAAGLFNAGFGRGDWLDAPKFMKLGKDSITPQGNMIEGVTGLWHSALQSQLANNARGVIIDQLLNSAVQSRGKPLIRLATKKELQNQANIGRIVELFRNGKSEKYITERYLATAMKFSPYVLGGLGSLAYGSKRAFEATTTGVLSPVFSATLAIRDALTGNINMPKGFKGPGPGTMISPARILGAKVTAAVANSIEAQLANGHGAWQLGPVSIPAQKQLAARLGAAYQNTLYHMIQQAGGADASMLLDRIQYNHGLIREVERSIPGPVKQIYGYSAAPLFRGLHALMSSIAEAPRFDAVARNVKAGVPVDEAVRVARNMTGDTMRSGRSYVRTAGKMVPVTGDVVDPKLAGALFGPSRGLSEFARQQIPWSNPTIQAIRRRVEATIKSPGRTLLRGYMMVGLPAIASYAWNTLISQDASKGGNDYVDHDMNMRDIGKQVNSIYFGMPGLDPTKGIEIPISQEDQLMLAPYKTFLHHLAGSDPEVQQALMDVGLEILKQNAGIATPPGIRAMAAAGGVNLSDNLWSPQNTYAPDVPEGKSNLQANVENMLRAQFGNIADMGIRMASAFHSSGDLADMFNEGKDALTAKVPIVKNLAGATTNSAYFTPIGSDEARLYDATSQFLDYYDAFFGHPGQLESDRSTPDETGNTDPVTGEQFDVPKTPLAPSLMAPPTNPLYAMFGSQIHDFLTKGDYNVTRQQLRLLKDNIDLLKGYNRGRAKDFAAFQKQLETPIGPQLDAANEELQKAQDAYNALKAKFTGINMDDNPKVPPVKAARDQAKGKVAALKMQADTADFIKRQKLDLSNPFDVKRLINKLEGDRVSLMRVQLQLTKQLEDALTTRLQKDGIFPPGRRFSVLTDLAPQTSPN